MKAINATPFESALSLGTRTAILIPANYNNDLIAAGLSLMMALKKINQSVFLLSPTSAKVGDSNLFDIDQLTNIVPSENFVITLKNAVPKLKRVKHFVDGDDLKFMLFPRENVDKFDPSEISYGYESANFDLIISIGQDSLAALSGFSELKSSQSKVLVISNNLSHAVGTDLFIIDAEAKSLCEIVARIIETNKLSVWEDLAFNIFQGLYSATNNFSVANLTQGVLEVASWAIANGANHTALSLDRPQPERQPIFNPRPQASTQPTQTRDRDQLSPRDGNRDRSRNRDRYRQPAGGAFDNRRSQTSIPQSSQSRQSENPSSQPISAQDWESRPKIYQGSTIADPESNK